MAKIQIINGAFQDSEGNPLAKGKLTLELSQDCVVASTGQVCAGITVSVPLDVNGNVSGTVLVWPNDQLLPANNYYTVSGYSSNGQLAWGPHVQQITGTTPFDLNTWTPSQVTNWTPSPQIITFQTKEVNNSSQTRLDLSRGVMVDLTDNGSGQIIVDVLPEFDWAFSFGSGKPGAGQILYRVVVGELLKVFDNTNFVVFFVSGSSPTADSTFTFDLSFDSGSTWHGWLSIVMHPTTPITFSVTQLANWQAGNGSVFRIVAPNPQDATLSGVNISVAGSQT